MNFKEYEQQINEWKQQYGMPPPVLYDPTKSTIHCRKCKKYTKSMSRHHKASDFLFARLRPDLYAYRYMQFLPEDTDKLCNKCHEIWHDKIQPVIDLILKQVEFKSSAKEREELYTKEWCEKNKKKILVIYNAWIRQPIRKRRKKHERRQIRNKRSNSEIRGPSISS